jgi:alpha-tubulin suppressor-like RCC1 family protein
MWGKSIGLALVVLMLVPGRALSAERSQAQITSLNQSLRFVALDAGFAYTCGLEQNGAVLCWGSGARGQIGDGQLISTAFPTRIADPGGPVSAFGSGYDHNCAIVNAIALCWGWNLRRQLSFSDGRNRAVPTQASDPNGDYTHIAMGPDHTCAVTTTGGMRCWGSNASGELGTGSVSTTPRPTPQAVLRSAGQELTGIATVSVGDDHSCALTVSGGIKCWGDNSLGALGVIDDDLAIGDARVTDDEPTPYPVDVVGLSSGVRALAAGDFHTCALTTVGQVKCWGDNTYSQIGTGLGSRVRTPRDVLPGITMKAISGGLFHSCAVTPAGDVYCWGANAYGQLGNGRASFSGAPQRVQNLPPMEAVAAGGEHTCATGPSGAYCWGRNHQGQLGDGTVNNSLVPVKVLNTGEPPAPQTASISGRVTVQVNGLPLEGVQISVSGGRTFITDGTGSYLASGLGPGDYTLTPSKTGYVFGPAVITATLVNTDIVDVNFTAQPIGPVPTIAIYGRVTGSAGGGVSGVLIRASGGQQAVTDSSGAYRLLDVAANSTVHITPSTSSGQLFVPAYLRLTVKATDITNADFTVASLLQRRNQHLPLLSAPICSIPGQDCAEPNDGGASPAVLQGLGKFYATLASADRDDIYVARFSGGRSYRVLLDHDAVTDMDLYIYDANTNGLPVIAQSVTRGLADELIATWTPPANGIYYVRVYATTVQQLSPYALVLSLN